MTCGAAGEVKAGGRRLRTHAWPRPGQPRVLLLHSLAAHGHWWDWAAPLLAERFDVLALDFRGHGGSDHVPDGAYGFESTPPTSSPCWTPSAARRRWRSATRWAGS